MIGGVLLIFVCGDLFQKSIVKIIPLFNHGGGVAGRSVTFEDRNTQGKMELLTLRTQQHRFSEKASQSPPPPSLKKTYGQSGLVSHVPRERY